jgi:bifunctional DNase/RNase
MLETEVWSVARIDQGNAVLLRPLGSNTVVPILIGDIEAHAILIGLAGTKVKRPLICDTLLELSRSLGLSLFRVEVYEIREDIFYARLFFSGGGYSEPRPLVIECRPSDAISLAVRERCGVYVASQVLNQAGIPADIFIDEIAGNAANSDAGNNAAAPSPREKGVRETPAGTVSEGEGSRIPEGGNPLATKRRQLQVELERVVEEEAYERAAEIRDLLILLDQQLEQER